MYDTIWLTKQIPADNIDFHGWNRTVRNGEISKYERTIYLERGQFNHNRTIFLSYDIQLRSLLISFSAPVLVHRTNVIEFNPVNDKHRLLNILNQNLEDIIDEDIKEFDVSRLDISKNLHLNLPTKFILHSLTINSLHRVSRKKKFIYNDNGILFKSDRESFQVYDKIQAEKDKKHVIPTDFQDNEILRLENQIKKRAGFDTNCRYGKKLVFKEIFYKRIIHKSKKILLENFKMLFGVLDREFDIISIAYQIKQRYPNDDLFKLLYPVMLLQNNLLNVDSIGRIIDEFYNIHKSRKLNEQLSLIRISQEFVQQNFSSLILNQLRLELGIN